MVVFLSEDLYVIMNNSPPPNPCIHCTTQPSGGLISGRISCIAFRFAPLTVPLLPSELAHCSMLAVWGYLGRLIRCLMSFETKISILASEWLYSLWEQPGLAQWDQWEVPFFIWYLQAHGNNKEGGHTNICLTGKPIFSSSGRGDFWVHGLPSNVITIVL